MRRVALLAVFLGLTLASSAPAKGAKTQNRTFKDPAPNSSFAALEGRVKPGTKHIDAAKDKAFELAKATFRTYVPKGYSPKTSKDYGVLVYVPAGDEGKLPSAAWKKALDRERMIWVSPLAASNDAPLLYRMALALHGAQGATAHWKLNPQRVVISGFSGGGNVTCWLALHYPEVFHASLIFSGCDAHCPIPVPNRPGSHWRGTITRPDKATLALSKTRPRAFVAGKVAITDTLQAQAVSDTLWSKGFEHVSLTIVPKLQHELPGPKVFGRLLKEVLAAAAATSRPRASTRPSKR